MVDDMINFKCYIITLFFNNKKNWLRKTIEKSIQIIWDKKKKKRYIYIYIKIKKKKSNWIRGKMVNRIVILILAINF